MHPSYHVLHHIRVMAVNKRILTVLFAFLSISSYAQMPDAEPLLTRRGSTLYLDGVEVPEEARDSVLVINLGVESVQEWNEYASYRQAARIMIPAAFGALAIGGVAITIAEFQMLDAVLNALVTPKPSTGFNGRPIDSAYLLACTGGYFAAVSPIILFTGVAFLIHSSTGMSRMVSFGPTKTGNFGFYLNF